MKPLVSVVIATRNRSALLALTLDALARQTWPHDRLEVIVVDNGSTDGTPATVATAAARTDMPAVVYLSVREAGKSFSVNAALAHVRGAIVALTDDDVVPEPAWIERLVAAFEETEADFVAGRILPRWEISPPSWLSPALYGVLAVPETGDRRQVIPAPDHAVMPIGANMAVRTEVIERIGGLRTDLGKLEGTLRTGEDHEFFLRMLGAGCRGIYEPTAVVHHLVARDRLVAGYFARWMYQNGRDVAYLGAHLDAPDGLDVPRLFGIPRYLWRDTAWHAARALRAAIAGDRRTAFAAALRVVWFAGYVREVVRLWGRRFTGRARSRSHVPRQADAIGVKRGPTELSGA